MTKIDALYEAAQKATPEPWSFECDGEGCAVVGPSGLLVTVSPEREAGWTDDDWNLAAFIAAADPQTVMALVEVYRDAQAYMDKRDGYSGLLALAKAITKVEAL